MFLGDSRLAFGLDKPTANFPRPSVVPGKHVVITAAHHGSRFNDQAYAVLDDWLGSALAAQCYFVRNGGMWKQTLGNYLTKSKRRCAQCQQCFKGGRRQNVIVTTDHGSWSWPPTAGACGTPRTNALNRSM